MIKNSQTKYNVKYNDGTIKQIECEPTQIKKMISQSFNVPYENIILINTHNNRMYSATNSFIQFQYNTIDLNVMDINQILKENINSKQKIIELQNSQDVLQNELIQQKGESQINKSRFNNKNNMKQENENFQELQKIEKQYNEKLMNQQYQYEQKITEINQNKEQLQSDNENLQRQLQEQIQIVQKQQRNFNNEKFELQQQSNQQINNNHQLYESEISKLQEELQDMQQQINQKNIQIQQLEIDIQEKQFLKQEIQELGNQLISQEKYYRQKITQQLEKGINDVNKIISIDNLNQQMQNYKLEVIRELQQIKTDMNNQENKRFQEMQTKLMQQIDEYQKKVENLQLQIKQFQAQLKIAETDQYYQQQMFQVEKDQYTVQLNKVKKDLDDKQDELNQHLLVNTQLQSEKKELQENNFIYENNIQQLKQAKIKFQANIEELEQHNRLKHNLLLLSEQTINIKIGENNMLQGENSRLQSVVKKLQQQKMKMNQKIDQLTNQLKKITEGKLGHGLDKVNSSVGSLINSEYGVKKFMKNPNCQIDETNYMIYRIKSTNDFLQSIRQGQFDNLQQFLDVELIGEIKTFRSLQVNSEGDLMKAYIIKVEDTKIKELKNRFLIRKDLKNSQDYKNKNDAAALSLNNILTQVLMDQFVKDLTELSMRVLQFQIAPQYVIQQQGKEQYYYCEEIIESDFKQINGGEQNLGSSQDEQFLNSFSKYSHILSQQELVITYINTVKQYMYDMIVSTEFGCFSDIDQGKEEYIRATIAIESAEAINFGEFYNQKLEKKAEEFIQ